MPKKPKLKSRKLPPCGPVDVPAVWKRIEAAVATLAPDLVGNLAKGATVKEINAFEKTIGRKLPGEVRASFRVHNGQRGEWGDNPVFSGFAFGTLVWASHAWNSWGGREKLVQEQSHVARFRFKSTPKDAIRIHYLNYNWIQLIDTGLPYYLGLDFDPGPNGLPGQVINFGSDEPRKAVWAWSWGWFLNDLAEELEAGNFGRHPDGDELGLILLNPAPYGDSFFNVQTEWAKAKTAGKRPFDPLTEEALAPLRADRNVMALARVIAENCDFGSLPILADALEDAGCTDTRFLLHCRHPGDHGCGCWAVNLLLGTAPEFVKT